MSDNRFDPERRRFLKLGALTVGSALLAPSLVGSRGATAFADDTLADENAALPKAMGYKKDARKVDTKAFPKRAAPDGKTQFCNDCQFYTAIDKTKGHCQILTNQVVMNKGWCNSWTKKA